MPEKAEYESQQPRELTPAQDFHGVEAFVTVPLPVIEGVKVKQTLFLVTSKRERVELTDENVFEMGFYYQRQPALRRPRWSHQSIEAFLLDEGVNIQELYLSIVSIFREYIDFGDDHWYYFMACWVFGTYFHRLFEAFPYVHLNGTMESGKTKTLVLTAALSFNGELSFNSTAAYMTRTIHNNHATCCIDEAERLRGSRDEDSQTLIGMYNSGYKKGQYSGKCEQVGKGKIWKTVQFEAYSPKMFASIKGLEGSLVSRCVPIIMTRSANPEIKNRELNLNDPFLKETRDKLYIAMLKCSPAVKGVYEGITDDEILGREWELWKPILTIATLIDPNLELRDSLRKFAIEVGKNKKETVLESLLTPKLLVVLEQLLEEEPTEDGYYPAQEIINYLSREDNENFGWLSNAKSPGRWIGDELRKSGLVNGKAIQKKIEGKNVKGYQLSLEKIKERLTAFK